MKSENCPGNSPMTGWDALVADLFTEPSLLLQLDDYRAMQSLRRLLLADAATRRAALKEMRRVASAGGRLSDERARRLARLEAILGDNEEAPPKDQARAHDHAA
jgi:hypothetical protein